jgi:hypothetical protein
VKCLCLLAVACAEVLQLYSVCLKEVFVFPFTYFLWNLHSCWSLGELYVKFYYLILVHLLVLFIKLFNHLLSISFLLFFHLLFIILPILSLSFIYIISSSFCSRRFFLISTFLLFPSYLCFFYLVLHFLPSSQKLDFFLLSLHYLSLLVFHFNLTPSFPSSSLIFLLLSALFFLHVLSVSVARSQISHTFASELRFLVHCRIFICFSSVPQVSITNVPLLEHRFNPKNLHAEFVMDKVEFGLVSIRETGPFLVSNNYTVVFVDSNSSTIDCIIA